MSFGYSVGDFITTIKLAEDLRKRFTAAPGQFKAISADVRSLSNVLEEVKDTLDSRDEITDRQSQKLEDISQGCQGILEEIKSILDQNQELDPKSKSGRLRVAWKRLRWDQKDIEAFQQRLMLNLTAFKFFLEQLNRYEFS